MIDTRAALTQMRDRRYCIRKPQRCHLRSTDITENVFSMSVAVTQACAEEVSSHLSLGAVVSCREIE